MYQNQKPKPAEGIRADENYAREVMQLFTLGLYQLNNDGSRKLDGRGQAIPSYSQADTENLARVFTGWSHAHETPTDEDWKFFWGKGRDQTTRPMEAWEAFHDREAKVIVGNVSIPAGLDAKAELKIALDTLFNHPNTPPFVAKQLIQRLVTSNPSPQYVERVARAFINNGSNVRGDLFAVTKAILTDVEARQGHTNNPTSFGKIREPLIRATHVWRVFNARGKNDRMDYWNAEDPLAQAPLRANSVFNFFRPDYQPVGNLTNLGLVCPECQITNEASITRLQNEIDSFSYHYKTSSGDGHSFYNERSILLDFAPLEGRVSNANLDGLIEDLNIVFTGGQLSSGFKQDLAQYVKGRPESEKGARLYETVHLITQSGQYAIQK
jgi:uncharacterized protein (DUF1800 family)